MPESLKDKFTDVLIKGSLLKQKDLDKALELQKKSGGSLGKILIDQGFISQKDLMVAMSRQLNIPPIDLSKYKIDKALLQLIPERMAKQYSLIPVTRIGSDEWMKPCTWR